MGSELGIGVALAPVFEAPQVEMLILKRVHQLMRDNSFLIAEGQPRRKIKLFGFWLVKTSHLFAQELYHVVTESKTAGYQSKLDERLLRSLEILGRSGFVQIAYHCLLDFVFGFKRAFDVLLNVERSQPAHDFEYILRGVERGNVGFGDRSRTLQGSVHRNSKQHQRQRERDHGCKL